MNARVAVVDQGVDVAVSNGVNAAAASTIAAVRATKGHELLAPKAGDTVAAFARVNLYGGFVDEFHGSVSLPHSVWTCSQNKKALSATGLVVDA